MKILKSILAIFTLAIIGYSLIDRNFKPAIEVLFLLTSSLFFLSGIEDVKSGKKVEGYIYTFISLIMFFGTILVLII